MRPAFRLATAAALLSCAAPALAHRAWLVPSTTIVSGTDDWVSIDAAISNDLFFADHNPMRSEMVKVWAPDGSPAQIQNAATLHYRSVFDVRIDKPGTWKIGTTQSAVIGSFKLDGVEWRVGGRGFGGAARPPAPGAARPAGEGAPPRPSVATVADIPANATDIKLTEVIGQNNVFITAGAPTTTVFQPTNTALEMVPVTHPDELVSNEPATFRFLIDGKPAAGLKVTLVPGGKRYRDSEGAFDVTTGADGVAEVKWPFAGLFWLNATTTDAHPSAPRATERRMSYTATLEVVAP
ncbi:DUF4198 domain-containing protein [Sphingomonas sp. H39-1-10]|uniref:DUF4198 domain-containing protein n=1 Tax=Sphingomonas pollutisoli TaxID=3030829 RepID=UPI0023B91525|nr:DUF4198 domain-containing protein [Sphingomonas pollutisoli]MDF0488257.1 DUF4198 domain-containing protein [Sphingomonas pollutisoli]